MLFSWLPPLVNTLSSAGVLTPRSSCLLQPARRLDAPFGTEDNPVVVPSEFSERIVGVADPDDDSLVR